MIKQLVDKQREYYLKGLTRPYETRRQNLLKLKKVIIDNQENIYEAFLNDFNKTKFDVISTELSLVIHEIHFMLKNLKRLMKPEKICSNLINFPSRGYIFKEPYGVTLVMAPWNYPLQLSLLPVVASLAAGNTVILKPSNYAENVANVLKKIADEFAPELFSVVLGGREENQTLLDQKFDFIFFTGGSVVGRIVLEKASVHLTPVILELGGKSPCVVLEDADLDLSAKRITWGKFLNSGQTCVAPDHIYVHKNIKEKFIAKVQKYIKQFYYDESGNLIKEYPQIINNKHLERLQGLIDKKKIVCGGKADFVKRNLEPTVLDNVTYKDAVMGEEIFGPIMPILPFNNVNDIVEIFKTQDKPLAFYVFTKNTKLAKNIMQKVSFGGGAINDTIMHLTHEKLPFGGIGLSGMGSYHGKKSFSTFSHEKSVLAKKRIELPVKYPPITKKKTLFLKWFFKIK